METFKMAADGDLTPGSAYRDFFCPRVDVSVYALNADLGEKNLLSKSHSFFSDLMAWCPLKLGDRSKPASPVDKVDEEYKSLIDVNDSIEPGNHFEIFPSMREDDVVDEKLGDLRSLRSPTLSPRLKAVDMLFFKGYASPVLPRDTDIADIVDEPSLDADSDYDEKQLDYSLTSSSVDSFHSSIGSLDLCPVEIIIAPRLAGRCKADCSCWGCICDDELPEYGS
ncbi:uncharacterized protein V1510DRAFT_129630 [Dipodascopsis tothii]|uniref:uncharacterized protein n=1 Tax=Dipodascopsis tothii TaxID=44089 RepID=UPI0034CEC760